MSTDVKSTTAGGAAPSRNVPLLAARVLAGLLATVQLAGAVFFMLIAPEQAVWVGPLLDVPIVVLMVSGLLLKLAVAVWPGLAARRRIRLGLLAAAVGIGVALVKIPVYDEPEGVLFMLLDAVVIVLLVLAGRRDRR